ncbi:DNA-damage-inducible protein D [Aureimonas pseudogalii]|uniref:DNA-damage-inducible protein D n=1 Tax=Aureimonas pseudogalii TaxID=1744844 RepID=A0A7W6H3G1_9HYPH|nr:DNA-damage-inducible protein D [Aureimonas pseudogalii]
MLDETIPDMDPPRAPTLVAKMPDETIGDLIERFEAAGHTDVEGHEYWFARDLQTLLDYAKWENFLTVIERARIACEMSGHDPADHFPDVGKMVTLGSGAEREIEDIALSRYASYLVAQNADGRKRPVAFAQTYFAIQTRRAELNDQAAVPAPVLSEDERRCPLRDEIKKHNKSLASTAKTAGVDTPFDFLVFRTHGYKGLYGGLDVAGIQRHKGLKPKQPILDHMGSTELAANLFRATQTEEKLRRDGIRGKEKANQTHYDIGLKVRQTIAEIGGTMPEALPVAEDIKKVNRRVQKSGPDLLTDEGGD